MAPREPAALLFETAAANDLSTGALAGSVPVEANDSFVPSRSFDLIVAAALLLLVLPLMAFCAVAVMLSGRGPILYRQIRIGKYGREFTCLKFRTMVERSDDILAQILDTSSRSHDEWTNVYKLHADPRVTWVGKWLRRYSLDELPQLFNVLSGDMSIVGPRPIVHEEIRRFDLHFIHYCSVKPGITGLWQVSGRHSLSYEERVRLDAEYAKSKTMLLDLLILWRTIPIVFYGQNE